MPSQATSELSNLKGLEFNDLTEPLLPYLDQLDTFLQDQVDAFEPEIRELVEYSLENSGKRIRSLLLFYSGWNASRPLDSSFIQAAAVIELVHLATLVHDDILDDAEIRHQRPTISQKFGSSAAVLFGDALFAHALKLAAEFPTVDICRMVSQATRRVCAGEIQQNFLKGYTNLSLEQYFRIIELKTAELFWLSTRVGGFLAGFSEDYLKGLEAYGRHLGIAYQIFDDVTDLFGEEAKTGKTLGTDLNHGKYTLPLLLLFHELEASEKELLIKNVQQSDSSEELDLKLLFQKYNILSKTRSYFKQQLELSSEGLRLLPDQDVTSKLLSINSLIDDQMVKYLG